MLGSPLFCRQTHNEKLYNTRASAWCFHFCWRQTDRTMFTVWHTFRFLFIVTDEVHMPAGLEHALVLFAYLNAKKQMQSWSHSLWAQQENHLPDSILNTECIHIKPVHLITHNFLSTSAFHADQISYFHPTAELFQNGIECKHLKTSV